MKQSIFAIFSFFLFSLSSVKAEFVEISAEGPSENSGSTTFAGFSFRAVIESYSNPQAGKSKLVFFHAQYKRPRGVLTHRDFDLDEKDVIRFSFDIVRHPFTIADGYPAFIVSLISEKMRENSLHPRTGKPIENNLVGRILIYPNRNEVRFIEDRSDGNTFDGFSKLDERVLDSSSIFDGLIFPAATLGSEDPMKVPNCREWSQSVGQGVVRHEVKIKRTW